MIFKFDIGDRVKHIGGVGQLGVVIERRDPTHGLGTISRGMMPRYQIEYTNITVGGIKMRYWLEEDDVILDKSYYRQEKLNQLL